MEERLREYLDTSDLQVFCRDGRRDYIDVQGQLVEPLAPADGQVLREVTGRDGQPAAYVVVGAAAAQRHPQLLDCALVALGLALGKAQLDVYLDDRQRWENKLCLLTDREQDILRLIAERDMTNDQIAREIIYSVKTVEKDKKQLFHKLGVSNSREASRIWDRARRIPEGG
jgi:DNA-binding CsgD family transcriptional regulator